jgi:hypothetical protein
MTTVGVLGLYRGAEAPLFHGRADDGRADDGRADDSRSGQGRDVATFVVVAATVGLRPTGQPRAAVPT